MRLVSFYEKNYRITVGCENPKREAFAMSVEPR